MKTNSRKNQVTEQEVDVLYQRLAGKWYAFSVIDNDLFMAAVPNEALHEDPSSDFKANKGPKEGSA